MTNEEYYNQLIVVVLNPASLKLSGENIYGYYLNSLDEWEGDLWANSPQEAFLKAAKWNKRQQI